MKGLGLVWTRWTDREVNRAYVRSTEQIQSWRETGTKVYVSTTGSAPLDKTTQRFIDAGAVHIPCHAGNPDHRLPLVLRKVFMTCLKDPSLTHIGVVDDDALFKYPDVASRRIEEVVLKLNPGACGPIYGMRWWWKFRNGHNLPNDWEKSVGYSPLYGTMMFTAGCQIYSREALVCTYACWNRLFRKLIWRSDTPMFMAIRAAGYNVGEFHCAGYDHVGLQACPTTSLRSLEWLKARATMLRVDATETLHHFRSDPSLAEYIPLLHETLVQNVKTTLRFAVKGGIPKEKALELLSGVCANE